MLNISNIALAKCNIGAFPEALSLIEKPIKWYESKYEVNHPDYIICLRKKAEILLKSGKKKEALYFYKKYFQKESSFAKSMFIHSTEQYRLDYWKNRREIFSEIFALEDIDPDFLFDVSLFKREASLFGNGRLKDNNSIVENSLSITSNDIKSCLKRNEISLDFIKYKKDGKDYYGAIIAYSSSLKKKTKFVSLWSKEELEQKHRIGKKSLYEAVCSNNFVDKNLIYKDSTLTDLIWGKLSNYIPCNSDVYFAPDGLLHILAIENLASNNNIDFEKNNISLHRLTSIANLTKKNDVFSLSDEILLVGGLDYDDTNDNDIILQQSSNHSAVIYLDEQTNSKWHFSQLDGMRMEIDSIGNILSSSNAHVNIKYRQTEESIKSMMGRYHTVHLSTHGYALKIAEPEIPQSLRDSLIEDRSLWASGIALTGANKLQEYKNREDGILSARELCDLDLSNVEFVVLSACQTALGDISDEGPAGIVRGLKKAGVKSIIATLWEVDDAATYEFMDKFYYSLSSGCSKTDALKQAREWMKQPNAPLYDFSAATMTRNEVINEYGEVEYYAPYEDPYYWASFILIDDYVNKTK